MSRKAKNFLPILKIIEKTTMSLSLLTLLILLLNTIILIFKPEFQEAFVGGIFRQACLA
jgi:hypothetical protein